MLALRFVCFYFSLSFSQLSLIDMITYVGLKSAGHYGVRWSRVLRPLLLVNITEGRQV